MKWLLQRYHLGSMQWRGFGHKTVWTRDPVQTLGIHLKGAGCFTTLRCSGKWSLVSLEELAWLRWVAGGTLWREGLALDGQDVARGREAVWDLFLFLEGLMWFLRGGTEECDSSPFEESFSLSSLIDWLWLVRSFEFLLMSPFALARATISDADWGCRNNMHKQRIKCFNCRFFYVLQNSITIRTINTKYLI